MPRLALALLTLVLAGCGASTYAQPKPEKLERAAEQTDALLGSFSFSEHPSHVLTVKTAPQVTSVKLTEQKVGSEQPFDSNGVSVARRFLVEVKGKDGITHLVAVVEVLDPTGLWIGHEGGSSTNDTLEIDAKFVGRAVSGTPPPPDGSGAPPPPNGAR